ncbi:MAG TPA: SDR family NAD(P)-dependent oxidoreductase [Steroidobacteraceae bacterium]|nr:SDR family NAD(P)-dependent oxidoreductase [Steroidobacteraceae bacterium]
MKIDLTGQVAIVTGAGGGLGRAHALLLAERGAKVVVNDLGSAADGRGGSLSAAESVVREIQARGGQAVANGASVTDWKQIDEMVADTVKRWGRVDILVNNAGILRDKTFAKMSLDDFRAVVEVHLMGSVYCTKAVWELMRGQNYGRIVMTTSSSGLYGNFGQSNYGAAKLALVGFMQTLGLEGAKYNVHVNCLAPSAATRMLDGLLPEEELKLLDPAAVSPALLALVAKEAPNRAILCAGAGGVERAHITLTRGIFVGRSEDAPEQILARLAEISDRTDESIPENGMLQSAHELAKAGYRRGQKGTT